MPVYPNKYTRQSTHANLSAITFQWIIFMKCNSREALNKYSIRPFIVIQNVCCWAIVNIFWIPYATSVKASFSKSHSLSYVYDVHTVIHVTNGQSKNVTLFIDDEGTINEWLNTAIHTIWSVYIVIVISHGLSWKFLLHQ